MRPPHPTFLPWGLHPQMELHHKRTSIKIYIKKALNTCLSTHYFLPNFSLQEWANFKLSSIYTSYQPCSAIAQTLKRVWDTLQARGPCSHFPFKIHLLFGNLFTEFDESWVGALEALKTKPWIFFPSLCRLFNTKKLSKNSIKKY